MGAWGYKAWENDSAADWFIELFGAVPLRQYVMNTIRKGVSGAEPEQIRAAAHVLDVLGQIFVWPNSIDSDMSLAIKELRKCRMAYGGCSEMLDEIDGQISGLESRLRRPGRPDTIEVRSPVERLVALIEKVAQDLDADQRVEMLTAMRELLEG